MARSCNICLDSWRQGIDRALVRREPLRAGGLTEATGKFREVEFQMPGAAR